MKKNFTFILLSLLLFVVGGAKSQTALNITGGMNWNGYPGPRTEEGTSWSPSNDGATSGIIQFHDNTPKNCRVGGKGWATAYTGTPQTFTVTLNNYFLQRHNDNPETNLASNFVLVAVKGGVYNGNDLETYNDNNWNGNNFKNGDGTSTLKVVATTGAQSTFTNNQLILELEVNEAYDAVYLYHSGDGGYKYIKVESIVRTEGAGKATAPTITPASTDYSGSIEVTITKGSGNTAVAYTVTGADGGDISTTFTADELSAGSKVLNLTGSGDITVTATGSEDGKDDSNTASCTYTYVIEAPTITPGTSNYDGELTVTITPGSNNHHAKYTVSGSNEDDANANVEITSATTLNLTGSSNIIITATGYNSDGSESSSATEYTYTYVAPSSGESTVTGNIPHTFNSWDGSNSITLSNSNFSKMELGDYVVFGVANVEKDGTVLGFRKDWSEPPYVNCTTVSSGNAAKGILNRSDTQWWLKVSNEEVLNAFKNSTVRMQGGMVPKDGGDETSSVDLTSITVYHSKAISETVDNSLTKVNDVIVELTRSFTKDMWNTVCLPFKPTAAQAEELFGKDYTIAKFTGVTGTTLEFTTFKIDAFEAGQPYLVKPTENLSNSSPVVLFDVNITAKNGATVPQDGYSFTGTFTTKSFAKGDWATTRFVATDNKLNTPNSEKAMKALRCYFTVPAVSSARGYAIDGFMDDDVPTDISATLNDNVQTTKVIYNLAGQRVANPTKGLYIVNGQKVVVK